MADAPTPPKSQSAAIRAEFDRILMDHISSLIDTREDIAALPFNLATIASLLLLAERENEIKSFPESPPDRYDRETFFSDIEEIGLELDEELMLAIQNLEHYGFVVINSEGLYMARESSSLLILVLDSIFPQMPGMNLVAYVSQAIDEVLSGRKDREKALQQFDQTLEKQGLRLSAVSDNKISTAATQRILVPEGPDPEMLKERRSAYLQKLKALRAKSLSSDAAPTVFYGGTNLKHAKIKELFPKSVPSAEPEAPFPESFQDDVIQPQDIPDVPTPPDDQAFHPMDEEALSTAEDAVRTDTEVSSALSDMPPEDETLTPSLDSGNENVAVVESDADMADLSVSDPVEAAPDIQETISKEDLIEQRIKQFEEDLAMPCPICGAGKVLSDTTEKGKTYYHCSNEDCRLISWGKPFPMECPVCKNPFLIEVPDPDGQIGLKCPRATCMYRKKAANGILSGEESPQVKKKVAVVKKKRRAGVRRVVRRKS